MKIINILVSLTILTIGASIDPAVIRAETEFDRQMRTEMEAETKALGQRIVSGTNPPLTYDQVRALADNLDAKYKAAGKKLTARELLAQAGATCGVMSATGRCMQYPTEMEIKFEYFTNPLPEPSYEARLRYFELNGRAYDRYARRKQPLAEDDAETKRRRAERAAKREQMDREDRQRKEVLDSIKRNLPSNNRE